MRPRAPQDAVVLSKRGLLDEQDAAYRVFSSTFERWIRSEIMAAPGEEESRQTADEWLRSDEHADLKSAKGILPKFKKKYWPILGDIAKELSIKFAVEGATELIRLAL
jgi:hypothetical protein